MKSSWLRQRVQESDFEARRLESSSRCGWREPYLPVAQVMRQSNRIGSQFGLTIFCVAERTRPECSLESSICIGVATDQRCCQGGVLSEQSLHADAAFDSVRSDVRGTQGIRRPRHSYTCCGKKESRVPSRCAMALFL